MGKSSTLAPAFVGLRRGNCDYGANDMNSIAHLSFLSSHLAYTPTPYLTQNSPAIYLECPVKTIRGQHYVY